MGAGSRDGAMVRAVISQRYHCGLDSILVPGVTCGLSFLLVLVLASGGGGGGSPGLRFSSLLKNQHFQLPIRLGNRGQEGPPRGLSTNKSMLLSSLLLFFIIIITIIK